MIKTVAIIILTILLLIFMPLYNNQKGTINKLEQEQINLTQKLNICDNHLTLKERPIIQNITKNITINTNCTEIINTSLEQAERQKWSLELGWCKRRLEIFNDTETISEIQRNYTLLNYQYQECNETITQIEEVLK